MKKKKLFLIMITIILVIFSITGSIAYYRYVYTGNVKLNTSNVVFNVSSTSLDVNTQKINLGSNLKPGSSGKVDVTFDSTGSDTDMYVTFEIERIDLPNSLNFYYSESNSGIVSKYYSLLDSSKKSETLTLYWYWDPNKDDDNDSDFINKSISAQFNVSSVQIGEYATMKNGYVNYNTQTEFWNGTYRPYIRTINFGNDLSNLPSECTEENLCWDISYSSSQNKKVYGYLVDSGLTTTTKALYNLYIVSEALIFAPSDCSGIFYDFNNLIKIDFNDNFNTSKVTDMSDMFSSSSSLTDLNLSSFNTSNVTDMDGMFSGSSSLTELDLSSFNTSKVIDMASMFNTCSSLTELDLSNFNTSNVTNMSFMFAGCNNLRNLELLNFNTTNVDNFYEMFYRAFSVITTINITNSKIEVVLPPLFPEKYTWIFVNTASVEGAKIIVNYTEGTLDLVNDMINNQSAGNVVLGSLIPEYTITISGNDDIKYDCNNRLKGTKVILETVSGTGNVISFKMNGTLIEGNTFNMPNANVTITDVTVSS